MPRSIPVRRALAVAVAATLASAAVKAEPDATDAGAGAAAAGQPTIADLLQRLEAQEQKIRVLERKLEIQEETATNVAATAPVVKASERGFSLQSADGKNSLKLRGLVQPLLSGWVSEDHRLLAFAGAAAIRELGAASTCPRRSRRRLQ